MPAGLPWAKLAVGYYRDPKFAGLSRDAETLYVRSIAWTVEQMTDGAVPVAAVPELAARDLDVPAAAAELVAARLWRRRRNGWTFPPETWSTYQIPARSLRAQRSFDADRKQSSRKQKTSSTGETSGRTGSTPSGRSPGGRGRGRPRVEGEGEGEGEGERERDVSTYPPNSPAPGARDRRSSDTQPHKIDLRSAADDLARRNGSRRDPG